MITRRITVISTQKNDPKVYNSSASTWGELRSYIEADFGSLDNMKAVLKNGSAKTELESSSNALPSNDCVIMLTQTKIKAGFAAVANTAAATISAIRTAFLKRITDAVRVVKGIKKA